MKVHYTFEAIGTLWGIAIYNEVVDPQDVEQQILKRIEAFDKTYSRFRDDSLVSQMAKEADRYTLPEDAAPLLQLYYSLYRLTEGAFTPLIGQTLVDAGYDAKYQFRQSEIIHKPAPWEEILDYTDDTLTLKKPALLDFGAAGKGYLIDIVSKLLLKNNIDTYTINAGGDIIHHSPERKQLRVGLEHPDNPQQVIGIVPITNQSICASAGNRRKWGSYHHIVDPKTAQPVASVKATWVVAETALLADALATCLFFVSPQLLSQQYDFDYVILDADEKAQTSNTFTGELFLK